MSVRAGATFAIILVVVAQVGRDSHRILLDRKFGRSSYAGHSGRLRRRRIGLLKILQSRFLKAFDT